MNHTFKESGDIQKEGYLQITEDNKLVLTSKLGVQKYLVTASHKELAHEKERVLEKREKLYRQFRKSCNHKSEL